MPLTQSIARATDDRIGPGGITAAAMAAALERCGPALDWLRARHADGGLPLLRMPAERGDIGDIERAAGFLRAGATDIVVLGTGGSSLGAQALCQIADHAVAGVGAFRPGPRLHFMDNLDPVTFGRLLKVLPLPTTRFVAISKSGGTGETLMQTCAALTALRQIGLDASDHVLGLSEPRKAGGRNGLRDLLEPEGVRFLEHHTGIGGRFSVLTNVGLLPASVAGLNPIEIRKGAARALKPVLDGRKPAAVPAAVGAALAVAAAESGRNVQVMLAYADRLDRFARWYVQLWAESLGKQGKGTQPVAAMGPVDQHSQLQLFIAGPADKLFTILTVDAQGAGPVIDADLARRVGEPDFGGRTIGDLVAAQGRATADTLAANGRPVRHIHVPALDAESLGELLMHFMLETIVAAHLTGVDAFDQPAVEEGKVLAKRYLTGAA
jgi:glucose-6-phosphate isomerase